MDALAITFRVIHDEEGKVKGFRLTGTDYYAQCFCLTFPKAINQRQASIKFLPGKIVFLHQGVTALHTSELYGSSKGGTYEAPLSSEEARQVEDLLYTRNVYEGYQSFHREISDGLEKGFELIARRT